MVGCGSSLNDWMLSEACICEASSITRWMFSGEKYVTSLLCSQGNAETQDVKNGSECGHINTLYSPWDENRGVKYWLWDTLALWDSFRASVAVCSRAGSMMAWIIKMKLLYREPDACCSLLFSGLLLLSSGDYFKHVPWTFGTSTHRESKTVTAAVLFWLLPLYFEKSSHQSWF